VFSLLTCTCTSGWTGVVCSACWPVHVHQDGLVFCILVPKQLCTVKLHMEDTWVALMQGSQLNLQLTYCPYKEGPSDSGWGSQRTQNHVRFAVSRVVTWGLMSAGLWCCAAVLVVLTFHKNVVPSPSSAVGVQEEFLYESSVFVRSFKTPQNHKPSDTAPCPRRPESSKMKINGI